MSKNSYTVYSLYYAGKPMEVATAKGFVGSTRQTITKCLNDHSKNIARGTHSNKHLNSTKGRMLELYVVASGLTLEQCNNLLRSLRPRPGMGWNITKACRSTKERHTGKARPEKTKRLISQAMTGKHVGKVYSEAHRKAISAGSQNKFRKADIYEYASEDKIASGISIPYWCAMFGYTKSGLYKTLNADFSKPHHTTRNCYFYRGLYARWSDAS